MDGNNNAQSSNALLPGTVLCGRYEVRNVLGQGGFGITYAAWDVKGEKNVAIKEYFPSSISKRSGSFRILSDSGRSKDFEHMKESFLKEAESLSDFARVPGIVDVYSFFEQNGTAYYVMELLQGMDFRKYLDRHEGRRIPWEKALKRLMPVADALSSIHEKGIIHRDVKPENIFIMKDGRVKLIDFGAARYSLGIVSQNLSVVLTYGYAPYEQYMQKSRQGPFTDVYAFGAMFYNAITGLVPPDSTKRRMRDTLVAPRDLGIPIPTDLQDLLLRALAVESKDRFQSMGEMRNAMENVLRPRPFPEPPKPPKLPKPSKDPSFQSDDAKKTGSLGSEEKLNSDWNHTKTEHPKSDLSKKERPKSDHSKKERPKSDHSGSKHPKINHSGLGRLKSLISKSGTADYRIIFFIIAAIIIVFIIFLFIF